MNRLAHERSPYLLQHADNPVDWFPWGDDAFGKARAEQKPIFVSIGYSTCHWCHVMEHESFENAAVAAVLNEHFVSVKVDREERPDVDRVYMTFVQATTGSGGWPMSVWVTPELKPFYGGTYFPPTSRWGRPGFIEVLQEIARAWRVDRARIEDSAESVIAQLRGSDGTRPAPDGPGTTTALPGDEALRRTTQQFRLSFDARNGGFGDAPKFPRPSELLFLLREYARTRGEAVGELRGEPGREPGGKDARAMALRTLQAMALGGMRDHVGGGFHRYSVDAKWRVPHFEKMLYDQAQLVLAFVEGAQAAGDPFYLEVAEDTLRYVMREMTDEAGGFYSAEDADSVPPEAAADPQAHKSEGAFYLWRDEEIDSLLGGAPAGGDAALVKARFGMAPGGNAPFDPQQEFTGKNLLYIARSVDDLAAEFNRPASDVLEALGKARFTMFRARLARPRPYLDDKVLTAWNGLMIAAFARAARVLAGRPGHEESAAAYLATADRAAAFIRSRMWDEAGRALLRRYRAGHAEIAAYAEDYAYLIFGLLELFQADPRPEWLEWAVVLQRRQDELFWDDRDGGWFSTTGTDPSVLVRMKEDYDGAEPSASSVAVFNLLVLSELVEEPLWRERIERTLRAFGTRLEQVGRGVPMMAAALSTLVAGRQQVIVVGEEAGPLMEVVSRSFLPFAVTLRLSDAQQQALSTALPLVGAMRPVGGHAAAYVCKNFTCRAPVTEPAALEQELASHA